MTTREITQQDHLLELPLGIKLEMTQVGVFAKTEQDYRRIRDEKAGGEERSWLTGEERCRCFIYREGPLEVTVYAPRQRVRFVVEDGE